MYILIQKSVLLTYLYYYYKKLTLNGVNVLSRNHSLPNKKKTLPGVGHLPLSCWSEVSQRPPKQYRILPGIVSCLPEFTKQETLTEILLALN